MIFFFALWMSRYSFVLIKFLNSSAVLLRFLVLVVTVRGDVDDVRFFLVLRLGGYNHIFKVVHLALESDDWITTTARLKTSAGGIVRATVSIGLQLILARVALLIDRVAFGQQVERIHAGIMVTVPVGGVPVRSESAVVIEDRQRVNARVLHLDSTIVANQSCHSMAAVDCAPVPITRRPVHRKTRIRKVLLEPLQVSKQTHVKWVHLSVDFIPHWFRNVAVLPVAFIFRQNALEEKSRKSARRPGMVQCQMRFTDNIIRFFLLGAADDFLRY